MRIGLTILDDCKRGGVSIIRLLQLLSEPQAGTVPDPMAINFTYPLLGILGPLTGPQAAIVGHVAMVYNVPLMVTFGATIGYVFWKGELELYGQV